MKPSVNVLLASLPILIANSVGVYAAGFDCTQAAMPTDFVICSAPKLLEANASHAMAWRQALSHLDNAGRKELVAEQKIWIQNLTSRCKLPHRGKPSEELISQAQGCVLNGLQERTVVLERIARTESLDGNREFADVKSFEPEFGLPDGRTEAILSQVLKGAPKHPKTSWVRIADGEPPFLFVLPGSEYCGASDCLILGFRQTATEWKKVYEVFGGEGVSVLDTETNAHKDICQSESRGAGASVRKTSHWIGEKYGKPETKLIRY